MRKRDLEIRLQSVRNFADPDPALEQYMTPATMAADILFTAYSNGDVDEGADTVFMNPPFGCQNRNADRAFLEKAMSCAECVYSIHMAETLDFVEGFCAERGRSVTWRKTYKYEIPHTFSFHKKAKMSVDVVVVNIR